MSNAKITLFHMYFPLGIHVFTYFRINSNPQSSIMCASRSPWKTGECGEVEVGSKFNQNWKYIKVRSMVTQMQVKVIQNGDAHGLLPGQQ